MKKEYGVGPNPANHEILPGRRKPFVSLSSCYKGTSWSHLDGGEPSVVNTPLVSTPLLQGFAKFVPQVRCLTYR